ALQLTSRQFTGEFSRRLSVAGSYQRARASRTAPSAGSVFAWVRQATSNGPPVQRIGTHVSGGGVPDTASVHDSKKSTTSRDNQRWARMTTSTSRPRSRGSSRSNAIPEWLRVRALRLIDLLGSST